MCLESGIFIWIKCYTFRVEPNLLDSFFLAFVLRQPHRRTCGPACLPPHTILTSPTFSFYFFFSPTQAGVIYSTVTQVRKRFSPSLFRVVSRILFPLHPLTIISFSFHLLDFSPRYSIQFNSIQFNSIQPFIHKIKSIIHKINHVKVRLPPPLCRCPAPCCR